jgi:DNA topoisomerase-3
MIVCIAEKPSVAQSIAHVLGANQRMDGYMEGNGYQVTWTFGHLCQLKAPEELNPAWKSWSMDTLPMLPDQCDIRLMDDKGIRAQFKTIQRLYRQADEIINCGDAGQEGELIQRWVMQLSGVRCPVKRLWISSLTEEAIREGFRHLKDQREYDRLYEAGLARAVGDWLLGMNCSRLFTLKYGGYHQVLSIGRVQTPTLAMVVANQKAIDNFKPTPYWVLTTIYRNVTFTAADGKFTTREDGETALDSIQGHLFEITDILQKEGRDPSPQLYDLTALQVDANKRYGLSAKETLDTVQSLYEKKLSTYPRVDTRYLSDDIYPKCKEILEGLDDYAQYTGPLTTGRLPRSSRVFNTAKVTDHHAIIPTGRKAHDLTDKEQKVYDLICRRFISAFMSDYTYSVTTVKGQSAGVPFKAQGRQLVYWGWRLLYLKDRKDDEEEKTLPPFAKGECGEHFPSLTEKQTVPPKPYTEATLLQAMETAGKLVNDETLRDAMKENGIGRPSSRAGIIETLLRRGYIRREKKNLIATQTGIDLIGLIKTPMLTSPELTGQWEHKLRQIERGEYQSAKFQEELKLQIKEITHQVKADNNGKTVTSAAYPSQKSARSRSNTSYHKHKKTTNR